MGHPPTTLVIPLQGGFWTRAFSIRYELLQSKLCITCFDYSGGSFEKNTIFTADEKEKNSDVYVLSIRKKLAVTLETSEKVRKKLGVSGGSLFFINSNTGYTLVYEEDC